MNVGIVTTWEERGAAYVSKQYYDSLADRFNVKIFARGGSCKPSDSPSFREEMCYRSTASNRVYSTYIRKREFVAWINRNDIKVVFFNEQNWWPPVVWCKELGVRAGAYIDYYTETTIPLFDLYDFLICNTRRHCSAFSWHPHAHYVPWGTDVEVFQPRRKHGKGPIVFFHSCGAAPFRKGTDLVIQAYKGIASSNTRLIIHSQQDLREFVASSLQLMKEELKHVEFIEQTVTAPGLYHLGDVYVYPSRLEGIGLTVAEAIACGLPAIVPDDGPMNEFVTPERGKLVQLERRYARSDGYYWPMNVICIEDLRRNMLHYVENPLAIVQESANARQYAITELDWRKRHDAVNDAFEQCLNRPLRQNPAIALKIMEGEKSLVSLAKRTLMEVDSLAKKWSIRS